MMRQPARNPRTNYLSPLHFKNVSTLYFCINFLNQFVVSLEIDKKYNISLTGWFHTTEIAKLYHDLFTEVTNSTFITVDEKFTADVTVPKTVRAWCGCA